jgi:hypothetical protein
MNINTSQIFFIEETFCVSDKFDIHEKTAVYLPYGLPIESFIKSFNLEVVLLQSELDIQSGLAKIERSKAADCNLFMLGLLDNLNLDKKLHCLLTDARDSFSLNALKIEMDAAKSIPLNIDFLIKKHGGVFLNDIVDSKFNIVQNLFVPVTKTKSK